MKKLLLVPMLLGLILLMFSFKNASGETANVDKNLTPIEEQPIKKGIIDIYKTNYDEINSSTEVEVVENNDSNFSVSIGLDRNVTRDSNESFVVQVNNADNIESCNYLWKIVNETNDERNAFGREVDLVFPKGEWSVNVRVFCGEQEANATVKVTAWEYLERNTYHYNAYYGNLEYTEREIFDHTGKYIIVDNGTFSKAHFNYDDEGRLTERKRVYYKYPSENRVTKYTYTSSGERASVKSFDLEGKLLYVSLFKYNEQGDLVSLKSGSDEEHLEEQIYQYEGTEEENQLVYETTEIYTTNIDEQRILNDDGQVTYEAYDDGYMKTIYEYSYYENGQTKKEKYEANSEDESTVSIRYYNDKGEMLSNERSDKLKKSGQECSYRTEYTYNKKGFRASSVDVLLGGECSYLDEVKREFTYDENGNITNVHSVLDGDAKNGYTTMKVEKFFTNELEEF